MMKILFIYANTLNLYYVDLGIASLSAFLKSRGHTTKLIDFALNGEKKTFRFIKNFKPDIICFSSESNEFEYNVKIAALIKKNFDTPLFCGGIHPTISPIDSLRDCFDGICIGEGEEALLEILERMEQGKDYLKTSGFWFKKDGEIIKNSPRPLIKNLDALPLFDYELFDIKKYLKVRNGQIDYMWGRGCPFSCSYCVNHILQKANPQQVYVRQKSINKVIEELKQIVKKYNPKSIIFHDDTFNISTPRLKEFCDRYSAEINIPFDSTLRADLCTEENIKHLKSANCTKVYIGVETGDEQLRKNLLNKNVTDKDIITAFMIIRKYGIHTLSFNMIGLPLETPEQIEKTIRLNQTIEPDSIQVSIFAPFPGTNLYKFCQENKLLRDKNVPSSYYFESHLINPYLSKKQLKKYKRWFSYNCYKKRSKSKAVFLLLRDMILPYYLRYGRYIPSYFTRTIYYFCWNTKIFKFMGK